MDLSIVVPAYNEARHLPELLNDLERLVLTASCSVQVVVVDDGSQDNTWSLLQEACTLRPWLTVVRNDRNLGVGAALKIGANQAAFPLVAWVSAYGADRLEDIWEMRRRLMDGVELVIASRSIHGGSYGDFPGLRVIGSRVFSLFGRYLLHLPVHDITNPFRAFRRSLMADLPLVHEDYTIALEILLKAVSYDKRIEEIPTVARRPHRDLSRKALFRRGWEYLRLALRARLIRLGGLE